MWLILLPIAFFILITINSKIEFLELRKNQKKILAEVVQYKSIEVQKRNDYTKINYPFVKIGSGNEAIVVKLRYANSFGKPFKIGEKIFVFWNYNGDLLYWNAYDNGIYKYLPEKWNLKKLK